VHVFCPITNANDVLYRETLREALQFLEIRLNWITVSRLSLGAKGAMAKALKEAGDASVATYLVVGSHGLCTAGSGFIVVEDLRAKGQRILPTQHVAAEIKGTWPEVPLFVDACYSAVDRGSVDYEGHDNDPKYIDANFIVAQWAEITMLERCTGILGIPRA
jgi:hypothetical protein